MLTVDWGYWSLTHGHLCCFGMGRGRDWLGPPAGGSFSPFFGGGFPY